MAYNTDRLYNIISEIIYASCNNEWLCVHMCICRSTGHFPSQLLLYRIHCKQLGPSSFICCLLSWCYVLHGVIGGLSRIHLPLGNCLQTASKVWITCLLLGIITVHGGEMLKAGYCVNFCPSVCEFTIVKMRNCRLEIVSWWTLGVIDFAEIWPWHLTLRAVS